MQAVGEHCIVELFIFPAVLLARRDDPGIAVSQALDPQHDR